MASIYVFEIDGWGEVGPRSAVTQSQGFADGSFQLTTATVISSEETGAMCWVEDCSIVPDGYYTYTAKGAGVMTFQASPADVTVTTVAVSGFVRVEDHYRISDGIPDWVSGSSAIARWYTDLVSVSESSGQRLSNIGGLASVDGFEVTVARRQGLAAMAPSTYLASTVGPVVLGAPLTAGATVVVTESAAPFAGESATTPSYSAQPAWFGTEAIDVRGTVSSSSTDGVTTYTATHDGSATFVTRGVLRTQKQSHPQGGAVFGSIPTPIGQIGRTFVYPQSATSHAARTEVARGSVELSDPSKEAATAIRFSLASSLLQTYRQDTSASAAKMRLESYPNIESGTIPVRVKSDTGSLWYWADIEGIASFGGFTRTGSAPIAVGDDGAETWEYNLATEIATKSDFPLVRGTRDEETWRRASLHRISMSAVELAELYGTSTDEGIDPFGRGVPYIVIGSGGARFIFPPESAPPAHVFEPVTWPRAFNGESLNPSSEAFRYVEVNPVDAILTALTSTGSATNGAHDLASAPFGMSIALSDIDTAAFTSVGNRLDTEGITAGSVAMLGSENMPVSEFIDSLAKTYAIQVATKTDGTITLIDMGHIDPDTTHTLDAGDLVGAPASLTLSASNAIESIVIRYSKPWVPPSLGQEHEIQIRASTEGITDLFSRIRGQSVTISPKFSAACTDDQHEALAKRWSRVLGYSFGVVGTLTCDVDPGFGPDVGDIVAVSLPAFPNAQDTGPMEGALCRIVDRVHVSRAIGKNPRDGLKLIVYGDTVDDKRRRWAPSGVVNSVVDATKFVLENDTYHGADFTSDADAFKVGDIVHIFTANWSKRSTVSPGVVGSISGDTVTLSTTAKDGSGSVIPNVGDKFALSDESEQAAADAARWAWLSAATPGYRWQ